MLQDNINKDLIEAIKSKNEVKTSTLRMLNSAIKNMAIAKRPKELEDADILDIITKQIKQHSESIEQFEKGSRQDLVEKEARELEILKSYLPQQLSAEEVMKIIRDAIAETAAKGKQDMGKVMKIVLPKAKGRYDNKLISQMINEYLQ